ncbi:hypothetical protein OE88DRAFT_1808547 [Heliocybe sulcata]|uniref:Uncharacterized protein n=1 Tax=Heliocybe sulcata TaxID=5364 RepID=A0A5C3N1W7_9AGAM|nr:hypothetical protein OE88DRAFT_1808547 [Heliocybe sulcata]
MSFSVDLPTSFADRAPSHCTQVCTFPGAFDFIDTGAGSVASVTIGSNNGSEPITNRVPKFMTSAALPSAVTVDHWYSETSGLPLQQLQEDFRVSLVIEEHEPCSLEASPSAPLLPTKALPTEDLVDDLPPTGDDGQPRPSLSPYSMDVDHDLGAALDTFDVDYDIQSSPIGLFGPDCPSSPSAASSDSSFDSPLSTPLLTGLNLTCLECVAHAHDNNHMCATCGFEPLFSTEMDFEGLEAGVEEGSKWMHGRILGNDNMEMGIGGEGRLQAIPGLYVDGTASKNKSGAPFSANKIPPWNAFHFQRDKGNTLEAAFGAADESSGER